MSKDCSISLSGRSWEGGAGSELHNQKHRLRHTRVPPGSQLRGPLWKSSSRPQAPTRGRSTQRAQASSSLLSSSERPSSRGKLGLCGQSPSKSGKPSKGRRQTGSRGRVGTRASDLNHSGSPRSKRDITPPHPFWLVGAVSAQGDCLPADPSPKNSTLPPTMWMSCVLHCPRPCLPDTWEVPPTALTGTPRSEGPGKLGGLQVFPEGVTSQPPAVVGEAVK